MPEPTSGLRPRSGPRVGSFRTSARECCRQEPRCHAHRWPNGPSATARGLLLLLALAACSPERAPSPLAGLSADELLARAIAFHDPEGVWPRGTFTLGLEESRPGGAIRYTTVQLDNANGRFALRRLQEERTLELELAGDELLSATIDGQPPASETEAEEAGLLPEQALRLRNYYLYLWGLPMKLRDPGAHLDPEVVREDFQGRDALRLRVTYDPEVGHETWWFWLDPESAALIGYRFTRGGDDPNDETVVLDGIAAVGPLRLPKTRTWFRTERWELLGTDELVSGFG